MLLFHSFLLVLIVGWLYGTYWVYKYCQEEIDRPIPSTLPFNDPNDPTEIIRKAYRNHRVLTILSVVIGVPLFSWLIWKIQVASLSSSEIVMLDTGGTLICCVLGGFWALLVVYEFLGHRFVSRVPGLEIYEACRNVRYGNSNAWRIDEMTRRVRQGRVGRAYLIPVCWFLGGLPIVLGFDSYRLVTQQGIRVNELLTLGEKNYPWSQVRSAELIGFSGVKKDSFYFREKLLVQFRSGQSIDIAEEARPQWPQVNPATLEIARVLQKNGVPVVVRPLGLEAERLLNEQSEQWQTHIRQLWRDVAALPGVTVGAAESNLSVE